MDNDDSVYQGQGLHLVGEESSKVSPVLHPYALPKFDFDEGHLRFDSLVENEVFLGIPSQEDNQWIVDFSRGSSGIEFSSSAANPCSIPRHNNVWSEATSSESVEMLLKSVGQEEMIPGESTIQESNAGDELRSFTKQMDDKLDKVEDTKTELPSVELLVKLSESNQNPGEKDARDKSTSSPVQEVYLSAYGSSGAIGEKGSTVMTQENLGSHSKSFDENQREVCTSMDESLSDKLQGPSISGGQVQDAECLSQDISIGFGKLNDACVASDVYHEGATCLTDSGQDNLSVVDLKKFRGSSDGTCVTDLCSPLKEASKVETTEKCRAEVIATDFDGPSRFPIVGNSVSTVEECNEKICSTEPTQGNSTACVTFSAGMDIRLQSEGSSALLEESSLANQSSDSNVNRCPVKVSDCDKYAVCSEQKKESDVQMPNGKGCLVDKKDDDLESSGQKYIGTSAIEMESSPVLSELRSESSEQVGHVIKHGDDHSSLVQTSTSAGDDCGLTECRKDGDGAASPLKEDSNAAAHVLPPRQVNSADFPRELSSPKQVGSHECGQSSLVHKNGVEEMTSYSGSHGCFAESNCEVEATNSSSPDRVKSVPLINNAAAEAASPNTEQKSHQLEGKRGIQEEVPIVAAKSGESRDDSFQQCLDSVAKTVKPDDLAAQIVLKDANQSSNVVLAETSDATTSIERVVDDRTSTELSDKIELCSVWCDPNAKVGEGAEAVDIQNHGEPSGETNHVAASSEVQGGGIAAEIEKPGATSNSVGALDLSQNGIDMQAGAKEEMVANIPLSDSKKRIGGKASAHPMPPGVNVASKEEKSFTFDISPSAGVLGGETSKDGQSVLNIQAHKRSMVVDGSTSTSGSSPIDPKVVLEISQGSQGKGTPPRSSKGASERKTRRGSTKSAKENARKENSVKETVPSKQSERGDRSSVSLGLTRTGQLMQLEVGSVEHSGPKPGVFLSISGSSLPDLNTSAPISLLFQQPFTDLQQVQLRAQIFVYGSLIQGVAPDEACMVSAFGMSDGGRSFWEPAWLACLERFHGQRTHLSSTETPVQSLSGVKASEQANKHGSSQSKVLSTPAGRVSSKSTPSPVVNPMIPLSSPLWNISTPSCDALPTNNMVRGAVLDYQALSHLHAYQTPPIRNFAGHTPSWSPQAPLPGSWVSSAQSSAVDINARFSAVPITETGKLTPIKESSVPISSTVKNVAASNPIAHDQRKVTGSHAQHSTDPKSRKRKKTSVSDDLGQISVPVTQTGSVSAPVAKSDAPKKVHMVEDLSQGVLVAGNRTELVSAPAVTSHFSTSVTITSSSNFVSKSSSDKPLTAVSPISSIDQRKGADSVLEKRLLKPEDIAKVEEAKLQAEEASARAAIAVAHCQNVWCQLDKHNSSGLMSDAEVKLASAAVAIAASASIAKAAAAAAKIASNVALQAKLMADEALASSGTQNPTQTELQCVPGFVNNMGNATPASILNVGDANYGSSSIIFAAREAARRKIEAASAASRHAENLEAIVKAAELAAEAVSQAGKVVAMGDPLPISKLVEAGPEGYWKGSKLPYGHGAKSNNVTGNKSKIKTIEEVADIIVDQPGRPADKDMHTRNNSTSPFPQETSKNMMEDNKGEEGTSASITHGEKDFREQKNHRASDSSKTTGVVPDLEIRSRYTVCENTAGSQNDNSIKESCLVEVFKDSGDFTGAWYSANVLSLKDGKALVCYTDLESVEGSGKLKEWIALEAEGNKPPSIRLAHPMTSITLEGTRKRQRAAARDYAWSLHDRVDAWIENCWREGVIIETNKKDETTLSIHFPAQGKTAVVRAWHLRPTLVWKDGEWIEWSNCSVSLQGDTPQEKRLKLGSSPTEGKGKTKMPKSINFAESDKAEVSRLLPLSGNEKIFNIGSTRNENKPETVRTMRSGLQKEGSKVIFGVPKPGKKRKFMEVSKHYVSDRSIKKNAPNDTDKFAKFLMPQESSSRGWRNNSKIDSKEKQTVEINRLKGLKSGKAPNLPTRTLPQKDRAVVSSASASKDVTLTDNLVKDSTNNDENDSAKEPTSHSSQAPPSDASKAATLNGKSERLKKGKFTATGGKLAKVEVKEKPIPEAVEPRRSNRRILPTSRLLEGLQSSLIISKISSVSHDKNQRSQNRGGF